jgi:hypothetical protein
VSRRAKLLITALFLVLLAVPVVYACLFWSIEHPLRFRCVTVLPEEMVQRHSSHPPEPRIPFIFEVRNTKPYPVYFPGMSVRAHDPDSRLPGRDKPVGYLPRSVRDKSSWAAPSLYGQYLPAHGVTRFEALIRSEDAVELETGNIQIASYWASAPRKWVIDAQDWVHPRLPDKIRLSPLPLVVFERGPATLEGLPIKLPHPSASAAPSRGAPSP